MQFVVVEGHRVLRRGVVAVVVQVLVSGSVASPVWAIHRATTEDHPTLEMLLTKGAAFPTPPLLKYVCEPAGLKLSLTHLEILVMAYVHVC